MPAQTDQAVIAPRKGSLPTEERADRCLSETPIRDTSCCCHPLTDVTCLRLGTQLYRQLFGAEGL